MKVWIEGQIVEGSEARISVLDHGLLYGDGVFEGMRVYGAKIFRLGDHMRRFACGARAIGIELPGGIERVEKIVLETARALGEREAYLRLLVTAARGPSVSIPPPASTPSSSALPRRSPSSRPRSCSGASTW